MAPASAATFRSSGAICLPEPPHPRGVSDKSALVVYTGAM
jgi:hypothetical protein